MISNWQTVPLGEFLTERKEFFTIDDFTRYKRARVQSHGKGIVIRDEIDGVEIKTKKQQAARTGEFLVAEIDAKVGGFGIVPPELDGAVVSSHYFLFQIDEKKCSKDWLNWFVRYNSLEDQVKAQGSTNYAAIRPSHVLNFKIPLPPLGEQYRIIERVQSLSTRIAKTQFLREEANNLLKLYEESISKSVFQEHVENAVIPKDDLPQLDSPWHWKKISDFAFVTKLAGYEFTKHVEYSEFGDVPVIRAQNISKTGFKEGNYYYNAMLGVKVAN